MSSREAILQAWSRGLSVGEIVASLGYRTHGYVCRVLNEAEEAEDPRVLARPRRVVRRALRTARRAVA